MRRRRKGLLHWDGVRTWWMEYGNYDCHILIGKYCALGHRIVFEMGLNHDYHCVTTYPFEDVLQIDEDTLNHAKGVNHNPIIIGNDV